MKGLEIERLTAVGMGAIEKLFGSDKLPGKVAFQLGMYRKTLDTIFSAYQEVKQKMIMKYCEKDEKGNPKSFDGGKSFVVKMEFREEQIKEFSDLLEYDYEQAEFKKPVIRVADIEKVGLSPNDIALLSSIIRFEE